jgi:DNA polymerase III subunit delta
MKYLEAVKEIKKGKIANCYYIYGTEAFMIEEIKQALFEHSITLEDRETNISIFDLEEIAIQDVVNDANTYPFFGENKLVIASNADFLKAKPQHTDVKHNPDILIDYLINPAPYTTFVIIAPYEKVDERKKVVKQLKKLAKPIACEKLKEWDMQDALKQIATESKVNIEQDVMNYIIAELGTDLLLLHSEIEKLALYVGEGNTIRMEDAELLLSRTDNNSALKLFDAILAKDLAKAITITKDLEKMGEDPIMFIALLSSQFRTLLHAKILSKKGFNQTQLAQQLKIHPYVAKLALQRQSKFKIDYLKRSLQLLTDTDEKIKTGKMEKTIAFELLLYSLIK